MTNSYAVVLTTAKSLEDARQIAQKVLSEQLVACAQLLPISSLYTWKGEVVEESEVLLLLKTRQELYSELEKAIVSVHTLRDPGDPSSADKPGPTGLPRLDRRGHLGRRRTLDEAESTVGGPCLKM